MLKRIVSIIAFCACGLVSVAQEPANPVIENFGGVYPIPEATVLMDSGRDYNVVVDVKSGPNEDTQLNPALNNVARMLNLHSLAGVDAKRIHVVLAIHGGATYSVMDDTAYRSRFGVDNPNTDLLSELNSAGVMITVCGQSLLARGVDGQAMHPVVQTATSMLTTVTTYHQRGYTLLSF